MRQPYHETGQTTLYLGDVREVLRDLPADSVDCVVTSPPYWSLRDYGIEPSVWGGRRNARCGGAHEWGDVVVGGNRSPRSPEVEIVGSSDRATGRGPRTATPESQFCVFECGAWRGALGLEPTTALFVAHMVEVFREVRRVLKPTGTAWVNLGDSYAGSTGDNRHTMEWTTGGNPAPPVETVVRGKRRDGLKPKDLVGIPWRVAFALQEDGWWLRQDIIWAKPNPMPESVTDRCTKSHEYLFLLSKRATYYYDADAIREPHTAGHIQKQLATPKERGESFQFAKQGLHDFLNPAGRNKRSVWTIPTAPFPDAHFATFPPDLVKPCILAGCPPGGVTLDPFMGSGTTGMVANELGRRAVGIDLNPEYLEMAKRRVSQMGMALETPVNATDVP